jgi:hypothetical protein
MKEHFEHLEMTQAARDAGNSGNGIHTSIVMTEKGLCVLGL